MGTGRWAGGGEGEVYSTRPFAAFFLHLDDHPVEKGGGVTPHSEIIVGDEPPCIFEQPCCKKGGSHPILRS